ncbi:MAG: redox-regulated ATPase YchF [Desulfobacteraceae bacterium]|nr:redox-regulated ATPase YchF [Desulfobacteraceae bacterium]
MKLGIIGLPGSGKATVFDALTQSTISSPQHEDRIGTITVPDPRVEELSAMYKPRKTIFAQVEYFLPGGMAGPEESPLTRVRDCDALIQVVRNFSIYGAEAQTPVADVKAMDQELIISDLVVVEKRLERLALDKRRGKDVINEELSLLEQCKSYLDNETPLRRFPEITGAKLLRGFAFLSAKPLLVLFNNEDEEVTLPDMKGTLADERGMVIRGKLEQELAQMDEDEKEVFLSEFNITASATDRVLQSSYDIMGLISFFTVGEDEVRAWTINKQTAAVDAAEVIHSDIKKGFIRAEVLHYDDLMDAGNYAEARKKGTVRLEGKTYEVKNGDIINFRFNV